MGLRRGGGQSLVQSHSYGDTRTESLTPLLCCYTMLATDNTYYHTYEYYHRSTSLSLTQVSRSHLISSTCFRNRELATTNMQTPQRETICPISWSWIMVMDQDFRSCAAQQRQLVLLLPCVYNLASIFGMMRRSFVFYHYSEKWAWLPRRDVCWHDALTAACA
jgi:hypothetical protein